MIDLAQKLPRPPVKPAQIQRELRSMLAVYEDLAPQGVVEIGTWTGGTLYYWLRYATERAKVISIDLGPDLWVPPDPTFDNSIWWDWAPPGVQLYALTGNSQDEQIRKQVEDITGGGIDWLFIDGDHTYEGVKADWETWRPLVRQGGVVAFHDLKSPAWSPHIQVGKLWQEIKLAGYLTEEFIDPHYDWGGIGLVYI